MSKKVVIKLQIHDERDKQKALKAVSSLSGIESIAVDMKEKKMTVVGEVDPVEIVTKLRRTWAADILTVGPAKEPEKKKSDEEKKKDEEDSKRKKQMEEEKKREAEQMAEFLRSYKNYNPNYYHYNQHLQQSHPHQHHYNSYYVRSTGTGTGTVAASVDDNPTSSSCLIS